MIAFAADIESFGQVVVVSLVAGVGVTAIFALAIVGVVRSTDSHRAREHRLGVVWGLLAAIALIGVLAAIAFGLRVVAS